MKLLQILLLFTIVLVIAAAGLFYMPKRTEAEPLTKPAAVPMCVRDLNVFYVKEYEALGGGIYMYGNSGYLLYRPVESIDFTNYERFTDKFNSMIEVMSDVDFFAYYIPTSGAVDFSRLPIHDDYYTFIQSHLHVKEMKRLDMNSFSDYKNYFYKTDHHWSYQGSYQGYVDILGMLKPEAEVIKPLDLNCFANLQSLGSNARQSGSNMTENFCAYEFERNPNITVRINDIESTYGNEEAYRLKMYDEALGVSHYGIYYGGDDGKLVFTNPDQEGNLLVIGTSFDNAIVKLLAESFNQVHVIDMRYYEDDMQMPLDLEAYMKENSINQCLLVGDNWFYKLAGE